MQKEFIKYEQALELKELGYNQSDYLNWYNLKGELQWDSEYSESEFSKKCCSAPLYQQAFRWFRENKLSDSCICRYQGRDDGGIYYYYCINNDFGVEETRYFKEGFNTYEEAELACLKKLIEIVKQPKKD